MAKDDNTQGGFGPSLGHTPVSQQDEPGKTNVRMQVPQDMINVGRNDNIPRDDSPESLDQEITQGARREDIDPQHSIDRPAIKNIDEEEHGVS